VSLHASVESRPSKKRNIFVRLLGPGLVTGAADDDPSGIATYSQAGAQFGYGLLWTVGRFEVLADPPKFSSAASSRIAVELRDATDASTPG
jgi:hypothetical protein